MANVRAPHRVVPRASGQPPMLFHIPGGRQPANVRRPPVLIKPLPILQAPPFVNTSNYILEENEDQLHDGPHKHPKVVKEKHRSREVTRQITVHPPTYILQQNYPRRQLPPVTTRPVRRAEPKYKTELVKTR